MSIRGANARSATDEITMSQSRVVKCCHASFALMPVTVSVGPSDRSSDAVGREAELSLRRAASTDPGRVGTFAGVRLFSTAGSEFGSHCSELDGIFIFAQLARL